MNFFVTGDKHGNFNKILEQKEIISNSDNAVIVLGDAGLNFYLNKTDRKKKEYLMKDSQCYWYLVRGNHEARPQSVQGMKLIYDKDNVDGQVWIQEEYPRIRYFMDYGEYWINKHRTLVLGGAYSVDKFWRLQRAGLTESTNDPKKSGWFQDEQMTLDELEAVRYMFQYEAFDFVLSHTCPISWVPNDLFLSQVNQSTVDNTMELWMDDMMRHYIGWTVWLFGHYHADRLERPGVEQYYHAVDSLENIWERWRRYYVLDNKQLREWWLQKSPNFYMT